MVDEQDFAEGPLDFSRPAMCRCPYCGETLGADELQVYMPEQTNVFVCPNCRKRLNIDELGSGL